MPSGHTAVYLESTQNPGEVGVHLDSPGGSLGHLFTDPSGNDVIDCGSNTNFLFVNQMPAASMPTGNSDSGIKVQGGSGGTLMIDETNNDDDTFIFAQTDLSGITVQVQDTSFANGYSHMGSGVNKLLIRTNDVAASNFGDGTFVQVPGLASGIGLTVDTGAGTYDEVIVGQDNAVSTQAVIKTGAGHDLVELQPNNGDDATNAVVDFVYASGLGAGNELDVGAEGTAHLANAPGTSAHTVYIDQVTIEGTGPGPSQRGELYVDDPTTIDNLHVEDHGLATFTDAATVNTFTVDSYGSASIEAVLTVSGTFTVDGTVEFTSTSSGSTVDNFQRSGTTTGTVTVDGGASVTIGNTSLISNLVINDTGVATMAAHGSSTTAANVLRVNSLTVNTGTGSSAGKLDLTNNALILDYGGSSTPVATVRSLLVLGYNGGTWTGDGITSSSAAARVGSSTPTALGFAETSDLFTSFPAMFAGQSVNNTTVVIRYVWTGDCNLDGKVDLTDFTFLTANFNASVQKWLYGDLNYDGVVDLTDFTLLADNYNANDYPAF